MYPISSIQPNKKKSTSTGASKKVQKVDEKQSKDIMNSLFEDLDQQDAEDLEQTNGN